MSGIDLSRVPPPDAILVLDHAAKAAQMKAQLIAARPSLAPALTLASEPLVLLIEAWAYELTLKSAEINAGVRAMLLATATEADLDNIAANHLVQRHEGEGDAAFRARTALAPEGWSTAGPIGAYRYHALTASAEVVDVQVVTPEPGRVRVIVLSSADDGLAPPELLAQVAAALNADEVRPLTDAVEVVPATTAAHDVVATIQVASGPDADPVRASAEAAVRAYAATRRRIGAGVARNGYIAALMQPGALNVALDEPGADIEGDDGQAPVLGEVVLTVEVTA